MRIFPDSRSRADDFAVQRLIWPNFVTILDVIAVLVICRIEEDSIKNKGARVVTTLFVDFSDAQGQLTPKSVMESCRNSNLSKLLLVSLLLQETRTHSMARHRKSPRSQRNLMVNDPLTPSQGHQFYLRLKLFSVSWSTAHPL